MERRDKKVQRKEMIMILLCSFVIATFLFLCDINIFEYTRNDFIDLHVNLITINSIIAGFSYTNLGILISIVDIREIKKLQKTDFMIKKNERLISSILFLCMSIIISLLYVLNVFGIIENIIDKVFQNIPRCFMFFNEFLCITCYLLMFFGIAYFMLSIKEVSKLIRCIYFNKSKLTDEQIKKIDDAFRGKSTE